MPLPTDPSPSSSSPGPTARSRTISQTSMATPSQLAVWGLSHPCRTTPTTRPAFLLTALLAKLPALLPTTPLTTPVPWSAIRTLTSSCPCAQADHPSAVSPSREDTPTIVSTPVISPKRGDHHHSFNHLSHAEIHSGPASSLLGYDTNNYHENKHIIDDST